MSGGSEVDIRDNTFGGGVQIAASGTVTFEKNQVLSGGLGLSSDTTAVLRVFNNKLPHVIIDNGTRLDFEHNEAFIFRALYVRDAKIVDNTFERRFEVFALANLEVSRNHASRIDAAGPEALVTENEARKYIQISTDAGIIKGNSANFISVSALSDDEEAGGLILVEGNDSETEMKVGIPDAPVSSAIVQHNSAGESLFAFAETQLEIRHNETSGIECGAMNAGSHLLVSRNTTRNSLASGIRVMNASHGRIESNISSANEEFGLEVRQFDTITVVDNEFSSNGYGGILAETILTHTGDCNGDGEVPVAEVITTVGIALGQRTLRDCAAVDVDGNERVTIGELIASVAASIGTSDPAGIGNGRIEILSNRVEANRRFGVNLFAQSVLASGNDVVGNEGIALAVHSSSSGGSIEINGNLLGSGSGEGILLKGTRAARVRDNFIFSNGEAGILLRDAPGATVVNNLIYDNGDDGIAVGRGTVLPAVDAMIMNNTLYANRGFGVTIGSAGAPSTGTTMLNNIVDGNAQGGVASDIDSLPGLTIDFNLNNDGYSREVAPSVTDFTADPRFLSPVGADQVLGRDGFADDNFHVHATSAAIDAGSATAADLGITGSAVQGQTTDEGIVDLGFHYDADAPSKLSLLSRL
jgi:parallel beta-helix repeat protein